MIKAVYANLGVLSDPERWNRLIEIADTTEINAIVIDVKQDTIYYDTQVPFLPRHRRDGHADFRPDANFWPS